MPRRSSPRQWHFPSLKVPSSLPTLSIVSPTEGQVIEQGTPVHVDLDIDNFAFENGSMIEGQLLINGQPITTQYLRNAAQLAGFEALDLSSMMTAYGDYTLIASLVNADSTQFATPATDTVHFSYLENDDDVTRTKACQLLHSLKDYALYDDLAAAMEKDGLSLDAEIAADHYQTVLFPKWSCSMR